MVNLKLFGARVAIKLAAQEDKTEGGVYLPDTAKKKPTEGIVVAVGPKVETAAVNDRILFSKYGGSEVTVDGEDYTILEEDQIYAVLG